MSSLEVSEPSTPSGFGVVDGKGFKGRLLVRMMCYIEGLTAHEQWIRISGIVL